MNNAVNIISMVLFLACWFLIFKKIIWNKIAPVKTVKAEIIDKYVSDTVSRYPGTFKRERHIIMFSVNGKKLAFDVSEYSFNNYEIKDKGTLKYKGTRIITFK